MVSSPSLFAGLFIGLLSLSASSAQFFGGPTPNPIESTQCRTHSDCSTRYNDTQCGDRGFCTCQKAFILDYNRCLPVILDLTSECHINAQCANGLGNLSRCNEGTLKCECYDTVGNGKLSTAYAPHTCYYRKHLGDRCDLNEECRASISPQDQVRCEVTSRTCQCREGSVCQNINGGSTLQQSGMVILSVVIITAMGATKVIS